MNEERSGCEIPKIDPSDPHTVDAASRKIGEFKRRTPRLPEVAVTFVNGLTNFRVSVSNWPLGEAARTGKDAASDLFSLTDANFTTVELSAFAS